MLLTSYQFKEMVETMRGTANKADRRKTARLQVQATALVTPLSDDKKDAGFTVMARDISLEGVGLISSVPLRPRQQILIHLAHEADKGVFVVCTVKHCSAIADGVYSHGVRFERMVRGDTMEPPVAHDGIEKIFEAVLT
jgi:hypothetical protein